ncbi:hypothetical protein [Nocardioides sp. InS609-2]|uniref:hypothetical protein n=1 Tax=Nocardioides sp. InS609-2 TaxID=2760705 RepID=UPI0020C0130D|nr:hypothetical protein [Nocardioides sp. InS609-2]
MVQEVIVNAERMAANLECDVLWLNEARVRVPALLHVAPLQVVGADARQAADRQDVGVHERDVDARCDFNAVAASLGLKPTEREALSRSGAVSPWRGIHVGSPFDYGQQAILCVARHLPAPGRGGLCPG